MSDPFTLDVREELRGGGEPLSKIVHAVENLSPDQALRLLVPFEPLPLYAVLERKGFGHKAVRHGEGDWEVLFSPHAQRSEQSASRASTAQNSSIMEKWPDPSAQLDNRGLQPPEPLVRILDTLEHLAPGQVLEAINERDPVFLYPELQARGASIRTEKTDEGIRLLIRRGG